MPLTDPPPELELRGVAKAYGDLTAVADLGLSVRAGEVVGLLGPNGAGKTTSLRMAAGTLAPDRGAVLVGGHDLARARRAGAARTGYLPEGAPGWDGLAADGLLTFLGRARGLSGAALDARVEAAVELADLDAFRARPFDRLSKGQRRRVALGAALLHDPPLLLLDEPTDGLDPNQKRGLRARIRELGREKAIVVSTHILEEVPLLCDRVVLLDRGRAVFDGTPDQLVAGHADLDAAFAARTAQGEPR